MTDAGLEALRKKVEALEGLDDAGRHEPATAEEEDREARRCLAALAEAGLLRHVVPAAFGGAREAVLSREVCALRESLAYRSGAADLAFVMQGLGTCAITQRGNDSQKGRYLPAVAAGEAIASIALTEPGAGSDLLSIETRARREGDTYVLDGRKTLISNAGIAHVYTLWARTSDDPKRGLSAFIVESGDPGFRVSERLRGMAAHPIGSLALEACRIPASRRIGREGDGLGMALGVLAFYRPSVGGAALGFARRALDETARHLKERVQFGKPLAAQQGLQFALAEMATGIEAAALLVARAAGALDSRRGRATLESAMAKCRAAETACQVVDRAVQIHGGLGVIRGGVVERLYREVRGTRIYEGTSEIQKSLIARELLRG